MVSYRHKNHYERLGVSRQATPEEIRRAFRHLARRYHPDVAQDKDEAQELFVLLNEAHQTLLNPHRRREYDRGLDGFGRRAAGGWTSPPPFRHEAAARPRPRHHRSDLDMQASIEITFEEAIEGGTHTITVESRDPRGKHHRLTTYQVHIPKGVWRGRQLKLAGCGMRDPLTGESGDLYLIVEYARDTRFRLVGHDLYTDIEMAPWDAALGAFMQVPTPEGLAALRIPVGAQPGQRFRLEGKGMPDGRTGRRGDLVLTLRLKLPEVTTARQRALWRALSEAFRR